MEIKLINLAILIILIITILAVVIYFVIKKLRPLKYTYKSKTCLMTNTELKYFESFKRILQNTRYVIIPQVCLSSIIERKEKHKFQ